MTKATCDAPSGQSSTRAAVAEPFDRAHIARYTLGDAALEAEIIAIFQGELGKLLEAIRSAASDQDWGFATHSLKGAARAIGAWEIAAVAERLERSGREQGQSSDGGLIAELETAVAAAADWSPPSAFAHE